MITRDQAEQLVNEWLMRKWPDQEGGPLVVWGEQTYEFTNCWVCYWVLQKYIETRDREYRLGVNYPILVDKADGALYGTGFRPIDEYVANFDADKSLLERMDLEP